MRLVDRIIELKGSFSENYNYLFLEEGDREEYGYETDEDVVVDNSCPHHFGFLNVQHIGVHKCSHDFCKECWNREYISS